MEGASQAPPERVSVERRWACNAGTEPPTLQTVPSSVTATIPARFPKPLPATSEVLRSCLVLIYSSQKGTRRAEPWPKLLEGLS